MDLCSVIVPCTRKDYIDECIQSILDQQLVNLDLEIIIVNDNPDDSELKNYLDKFLENEKIRIINNDINIGLSCTRNRGIEESKGDYLYFLDDDDFLCNNNALQEMYELIKQNGTPLVISSNCKIDKDNINKIKLREYYIALKHDNSLRPVSSKLFLKKYLLDNNLLFKEGIIGEEDYQLYSILILDPEISVYNNIVYNYRNTPNSLSKSTNYVFSLEEVNWEIAKKIHNCDHFDFEFKNLVYLNISSHSKKIKSYFGFF